MGQIGPGTQLAGLVVVGAHEDSAQPGLFHPQHRVLTPGAHTARIAPGTGQAEHMLAGYLKGYKPKLYE